MKNHRLNELIALLQPAWQQEPECHLLDILIYHLKMRDADSTTEIPGIRKDYEADFKTALLRARGVIKADE